ncbi:hypothetical protein BAZOLSSOX_243 [uncultured Gammaproteobacteria bacterium]|nr:hypothetical protein BAZOLSSOX_243 [uncultured Gammaproteobacteria bacterium]
MAVYLILVVHSPPHRWLRNDSGKRRTTVNHSPPHRWLRNSLNFFFFPLNYSPPHRWLRKHSCIK